MINDHRCDVKRAVSKEEMRGRGMGKAPAGGYGGGGYGGGGYGGGRGGGGAGQQSSDYYSGILDIH
jgi:hypothetical protein